MKSKNNLTALLIAGGVLTGLSSYIIAKYTQSGLLQISPFILFPVIIVAILSKKIKHYFLPNKGATLILISQITAFTVLYILYSVAPLPGVSQTIAFSLLSLIYLALIGISFLISVVLRVLIYCKAINNENTMQQPLHS